MSEAWGIPTAAVLAGLLLVGGCASAPPRPPPRPPPSAAEVRGHELARQICAVCHAVEAAGDSPDRRAPAFRTMSGEYLPLTLQRKLTEIAETGHYAMPATRLDSDQVADVTAYLDSLSRP
jgi:mono/diheme cytochrome c family protein